MFSTVWGVKLLTGMPRIVTHEILARGFSILKGGGYLTMIKYLNYNNKIKQRNKYARIKFLSKTSQILLVLTYKWELNNVYSWT